MDNNLKYNAVVVGVSAGGLNALKEILMHLSENFELPIIIVQHLHAQSDSFFVQYLDKLSKMTVKEAEEKEKIVPGMIYIAPPNYHLLIEENCRFSLSLDEKINFSRPSIDILFESAADVFGPELIGVILTGANSDGTSGMIRIKERGGFLIVQDPTTAEVATMPMSVIRQTEVDRVISLEKIAPFLDRLAKKKNKI